MKVVIERQPHSQPLVAYRVTYCYSDTVDNTKEDCSLSKHDCHENSPSCLSPAAARCTNADHDTNGDGKKDYSTTCSPDGSYASSITYQETNGVRIKDSVTTYYASGNEKTYIAYDHGRQSGPPECYSVSGSRETCTLTTHGCHAASNTCINDRCVAGDHDTNGDGKKDYAVTCYSDGSYASRTDYKEIYNFRTLTREVSPEERTYYQNGELKTYMTRNSQGIVATHDPSTKIIPASSTRRILLALLGRSSSSFTSIPQCYSASGSREACTFTTHGCQVGSNTCINENQCVAGDHDTDGDMKKNYSVTCHSNGSYATRINYLSNGESAELTYYEKW